MSDVRAENVRMRRDRRPPLNRVALAALGLAVVGPLAGCSPIQDGKTGITRDADGHLVGLAQPCEGKYDGAGIFLDDDPNAQTLVHIAEWARDEPSGDLITWRLDESAPSAWTHSKPLTVDSTTPGHTYVMDAFGENQKWSANDLRFTAEDLRAITKDTVLTGEPDSKSGEPGSELVARYVFMRSACE